MNLSGKTVVVTGASAGLGRRFSESLVERGTLVFGIARRTDRLEALEKSLGDGFRGFACDVSEEEDVRRAFEAIETESGRIDVLINNAGLGRFGPVDEMNPDDWDEQMSINLRGVFLCTRACLPVMKKQNGENGFGGHIVNVSSVAGLIGNANISAYNASKFGIRGFSEALMKEVRGDGIKVTCIYPGSVQTEFFEVANVPISANPMTADDIASTVLHVLESSENYLISEVVMRPLRPNG